MDYGHMLDRAAVERGLQELNVDIHFDMGVKLGMIHPYQDIRQGVFWKGTHICSMDRGMVNGDGRLEAVIPEFKVWDLKLFDVPVSIIEADSEDVKIKYEVVRPDTPGYEDMWMDARRGRNHLVIREDGSLARLDAFKTVQAKNRVRHVGWRHTFERIILAKIPGAGRHELGQKFGVDMYLFPQGTPMDTMEAIVQE